MPQTELQTKSETAVFPHTEICLLRETNSMPQQHFNSLTYGNLFAWLTAKYSTGKYTENWVALENKYNEMGQHRKRTGRMSSHIEPFWHSLFLLEHDLIFGLFEICMHNLRQIQRFYSKSESQTKHPIFSTYGNHRTKVRTSAWTYELNGPKVFFPHERQKLKIPWFELTW